MKEIKQLSSSLENYLKAIYSIVNEKQAARVKDISKHLGIGPSSVSEALRNLADKELINYEPYGVITLTPSGIGIAERLNNRHEIICTFFRDVLMVNNEIVNENTRKIEFGVSSDVLDKFVKFLEFMQVCSCKEPKWIKSFKHYSSTGSLEDQCRICIKRFQENSENNKNSCKCENNQQDV